MNIEEFPFPIVDHNRYDAECSGCEKWVSLTDRDHSAVLLALFYDKRDKGNKGRCLRYGIEHLGLEAGDRLEPSSSCQDVGEAFDNCVLFPLLVCFWRNACSARIKHRNPFFRFAAGITVGILTVEFMHTFHLGIVKEFLTQFVWEVLLCDAFNVDLGFTGCAEVATLNGQCCWQHWSRGSCWSSRAGVGAYRRGCRRCCL